MAAAVGRAWGWLRSWGARPAPQETATVFMPGEDYGPGKSGGLKGWASWLWGGWRRRSHPMEEFWEAQERLQPAEVEDLTAGKQEVVPRWWSRYLPTPYLPWKTAASRPRQRRCDADGDFSDYGTPPPSPTPPSQIKSPFRFFVHGWNVEILPEHHEICFNFLRHLFDLFVVGFLWTVSPPVKLVLEVFGIQGALRLWLHGMAMFFVSTAGMGGLLWLIQEYLPEFALIYGIVQAIVISISVKQSVLLGGVRVKEEEEEEEEDKKEAAGVRDCQAGLGDKEKLLHVKGRMKTS